MAAIVAGVLVLVALAVAIPLLISSKDRTKSEQAAADRAAARRSAAQLRAEERPVAGRLTVAVDRAGAPAAQRLRARARPGGCLADGDHPRRPRHGSPTAA